MKTHLAPVLTAVSMAILCHSAGAQEPAAPAASVEPAASVDFGDFSSETITGKAWEAYTAGNYDLAITYADKCIEMFQAEAVKMQASLSAPLTEKEEIFSMWALNDVATCYFIKGQALEAQGNAKEASVAYKYVAENLAFGQCWDANGWFWSPASAAKEKAESLEFESL